MKCSTQRSGAGYTSSSAGSFPLCAYCGEEITPDQGFSNYVVGPGMRRETRHLVDREDGSPAISMLGPGWPEDPAETTKGGPQS